ncbi:N-acetylmuramoyl-L-alanine amidase [Paenibacillus sp. HJGM_3]|uniref:N-acetylmuramoyl-L-alanine amidase n=1 Tax=Paenibacillus sp. HJGM_3 TaxID=3379816 RepID=UPI00385B2C4A
MIGNKNDSETNRDIRRRTVVPTSGPIARKNPFRFHPQSIGITLTSAVMAGMLLLGTPLSAEAAKIMVDAGHGGSDPGAIGVTGLKEKEVNLDIAQKLQSELILRGYEVAMTRQDDRYISLADRVAITNASNSDLFVSIHANSNPSSAISGTQVLYYDQDYPQSDYPASDAMTALTPKSKALAQSVLSSVLAVAKLPNKGLVPSAVYVVRMGQIPSILVETAFLSNWSDSYVLADNTMRQKFASGIADGIQAILAPTPETAEFADLVRHWAKDAVIRLKDKGIVESAKYFNPDRSITRAELLTMLNRQFDFGARLVGYTKSNGTPSFKDLPATHWAVDVFNKAYALGYVDGYPDRTIRPDQPVTRAEAALLLQRVMLLVKPDKPVTSTGYTDVPGDSWAASAIVQLSQRGLVNGVADGKFAPDKSMTRAEMATLLDRVKPADIPKPSATPTPKPSVSPSATPSPSVTPSATPLPTQTPSPSTTPGSSPAPSATPKP